LVFNRPELTKRVFEIIRKIKPTKLFIAADGPRLDREGEIEKCEEVRKIATQIDWDCELITLFRDENLGCGKAVSQGISWFFEHVEEGIILEDDCLPDLSFFRFCEELLAYYRNDDIIMSISGSNILGYPYKKNEQSYFFGHGGIWGWATWKRAWAKYDFKMHQWSNPLIKKLLQEGLQSKEWYDYYFQMFDATYKGELDTWDIQWLYTILISKGLCINPSVNLVKNIGFGDFATHTIDSTNILAKLSSENMKFPLKHSVNKKTDGLFLHLIYEKLHPNQIKSSLIRRLFNLLIK